MQENHRPVTNAVESFFGRLRSWAQSLREGEQGLDLLAGSATEDPMSSAPAEVLWSGRPRYRWWHSPLLRFDFLFSAVGAVAMAAASTFVFITGGFVLGAVLSVMAVGFGLGSVDELKRGYSDRRKRYYVLTEVSLKDRGVTSMLGAQLWAITRFELRRHRDGAGTISYWTRHGEAGRLLRLEDAEVVYLMLWEYIDAAHERREPA